LHACFGDEVKFLTGTDDTGQKVFRRREEARHEPRMDRSHSARFCEAWDAPTLTTDDFNSHHEPVITRAWQNSSGIYENGYIYKDLQGLYLRQL